MLYIPERDSCTVWTANNTPLQRDSETLYWFPSSANIDCWQVQSSPDDDTWTSYVRHREQTSSGIVGFQRAPCSLCGARHPLKCKSLLCQSIQGSPVHSPSTRRNLRSSLAKTSSSALEGGVDGKTWSGVTAVVCPSSARTDCVFVLASGRGSTLKLYKPLTMKCAAMINRLLYAVRQC